MVFLSFRLFEEMNTIQKIILSLNFPDWLDGCSFCIENLAVQWLSNIIDFEAYNWEITKVSIYMAK